MGPDGYTSIEPCVVTQLPRDVTKCSVSRWDLQQAAVFKVNKQLTRQAAGGWLWLCSNKEGQSDH